MDKNIIAMNFSRYAHLYDRYAKVQKHIAFELLKEAKENNLGKILEIGCGTGNYTLMLRKKFKNAQIKAVDISKEMVEIAKEKLPGRKMDFVVSDAQNLELDETFDLITSNACLQWFADLEKALLKYKKLLKKGAYISFSVFGPLTFWELEDSLRYISKNALLSARSFWDKEKIKKILQKNFKDVRMEEMLYTERSLNLKELLYKIKYTGIRGNGLNTKRIFTPQFLNRLEERYLDKFKEIKATYQVFLCRARSL